LEKLLLKIIEIKDQVWKSASVDWASS